MKTLESKKLSNALPGILRDALSGGREIAKEQKGMFFSFLDLGGLALSRAEAKKIHEAADLLVSFYPKVARKSILNELQRFCCGLIPCLESPNLSENIAERLPPLLALIGELQNQTTTVYHEVSGFDLKLNEWIFGPAKFMRGNHSEIEAERIQIISLDGQTPPALKPESIVVQLRLEGETAYATEHAAQRVQEILDCLQFLSLQENQGSWDGNVLHFSLLCCEPIPLVCSKTWSFSSNGPRWVGWNGKAPIPVTGPVKCQIDETVTERFAKRGGPELSKMLNEKCPSSFDKALLVAITWMANGIREPDSARKFLSFHIALEALFGRDNKESLQTEGFQKPIMPIEEGVAFLLGRKVSARKRLKDRIVELARTRNRIVHRGFMEIDRTDLVHLATYAWSCCYEAVSRRDQFQTENSFSEWLLDLKYGNADIERPTV